MNVLIIEDNEVEQENLRILLSEFKGYHLIGTADTIQQGIEQANSEHPDLIFLDIQLECQNSLEHLHKLNFEPRIICCTLYDEHALQAFEVGVSDYLIKPITHQKLCRALTHLNGPQGLANLDRMPDALPLNTGTITKMVKFEAIIQIVSDHNYTTVRTESNEEFLCTRRMQEWAELLPIHRFITIDRSTIINQNQISSFSQLGIDRTAKITFKNEHTLKIGPTALRRLKSIFQ